MLFATRAAAALCAGIVLWFTVGIPVAQAQISQTVDEQLDTVSGGGALPLNQLEVWDSFLPRIGFAWDSGATVGYRDSFMSLNAFVPFSHPEPNRLLFADVRGLFSKDGAQGGSAGLGGRVYFPGPDAVLGTYLFYDYRSTGFNQFQQISPGIELLTEDFDLRVNGYLTEVGGSGRRSTPSQFRDHYLFIDRFETAMSGWDAEIGLPLPRTGRLRPEAFAGLYQFNRPARADVRGWKARLQAYVSDSTRVWLSVQHDNLFETAVNCGFEIRTGVASLVSTATSREKARRLLQPPGYVRQRDRLADPIYRNRQIVVDQSEESVARHADTLEPIFFLHAVPGGSGSGTIESPYGLLTGALADARYTAGNVDVIYVHQQFQQNTTHTGDFPIVDETALLSTGPMQVVETHVGDRVLPFSGRDPNESGLPIILGRVTMGNHTTLSGFEVTAEDQTNGLDGAVIADGVVGFKIDHNKVENTAGDFGSGILLTNINVPDSSGRITIADNETLGEIKLDVNGTTQVVRQNNGIEITGGTRFEGDIVRNISNGNVDSGLFISNVPLFVGNITDNEFDVNDISGVAMLSTNFEGTINDNLISRNKFTGLELTGDGSTTFTGEIARNQIDGVFDNKTQPAATSRTFTVDKKTMQVNVTQGTATPDGFGINMQSLVIDATIKDNALNNHKWGGLYIKDSEFAGTIASNKTNNNSADGISVLNTKFNGDITSNESTGNLLGGILLDAELSGAGSFTGTIASNNASSNGVQGIGIIGGGAVSTTVSGNTTDNNGDHGIVITVDEFDAALLSNHANGNGGSGIVLNSQMMDGNLAGNIAHDNGQSGIVIGAFDSTFAGNVSFNDLQSNKSFGIEIIGTDFTGSVVSNTAKDNLDDGISVLVTGLFKGNMSTNTSSGNKSGIVVSAPTFDGQIINNVAESNREQGIFIDSTLKYDGSILSNMANKNGGTGIKLSLLGEITGDVSSNTTNMNNIGIEMTALPYDGLFFNNTANNNTQEGMIISFLGTSPSLDEIESNDTRTTAQNVDGGDFVLTSNLNIGFATSLPHLTVNGTGNGTFDYYSFTAGANTRGIFDIDGQNFDTELFLFDSIGTLLAENDDAAAPFDLGDGTPDFLDSYLDYPFTTAGTYAIAVGKYDSVAGPIGGISPGVSLAPPATGDIYTLHISLEGHALGGTTTGSPVMVNVLGNHLMGNNGGGTELVIDNRTTGNIMLSFEDNVSLNTTPINFDFLNGGAGIFTVDSLMNNTGTVGSSNASVTIP